MNNANLFNMIDGPTIPQHYQHGHAGHMMVAPGQTIPDSLQIKQEMGDSPQKKKRGRKKKDTGQDKITDHLPVKKKKRDRFNGMSEDEVLTRELPDHLHENLDILIVGINPGLCAAYVGHHYAGPGNHFWKCLFLSGLIPEQLNAYDDYKLVKYGIGFTNIVARTTRGSADLTRKEIKEGAILLTEKIMKYRPKIAVFNGKGIYEVFIGHKNFAIGKQPEPLAGTDTVVYVMPSSSARCSQLPRAVDKVPFYAALKKLRDYLRGDLKELDDSEVCFPDLELKVVKREPKQEKTENESSSPYFGDKNIIDQPKIELGQPNFCNPHDQSGFMSIKQENPYHVHDYQQISACSQNNFSNNRVQEQSVPPMFNHSDQFMGNNSGYYHGNSYPQQMHTMSQSLNNQQENVYQGNCYPSASVSYNTQGQVFTQTMAMSSRFSFQQGQSFQMNGQYSMSMTGSWAGSVQVKQEPHMTGQWAGSEVKQEPQDWSSGIPEYDSSRTCSTGMIDQANHGGPQGMTGTQGQASPLQMLENLSQGLNNPVDQGRCSYGSHTDYQQSKMNACYSNPAQENQPFLPPAENSCGSPPESLRLPPPQSTLQIPDISCDLPQKDTSHTSLPANEALGRSPQDNPHIPCREGWSAEDSTQPRVKSEPKDFSTDNSCPFSA